MRRLLKDKELQYITKDSIDAMLDGDELDIFMTSANQTNGYFLGHDGSNGISHSINTCIYTAMSESAYLFNRGVYNTLPDDFKFKLYKQSPGIYIYRDYSTTVTALPTETINVLLENTYNGVTRYLGTNNNSVLSTTNLLVAKTDLRFYWLLLRTGTGTYRLYNPQSGMYIRYSNNAYRLSTTSSTLYFAVVNGKFTIANTNSTWSTKYFMYMSSNTALSRTSSTSATERLWTIILPNLVSPTCTDNPTEELTSLPTQTINNVLLRNTYNGTTRYLGMTTNNGVTSTTDMNTALSSDYYQWNLVYSSSGRFYIQNAHDTNRRIRYSSNAFSISTTQTLLYVGYTTNSGFRIMGSSNNRNYMYMSGTSTLSRNLNQALYWTIFVFGQNLFDGWKPPKLMTVEKALPDETTSILAGYNYGEILTLGETCLNTSVYLTHGTSVSELNYTKNKTDADCSWILYNINKINNEV